MRSYKSLTTEQAKQYARQILLPDMDLDGQEKLLNAKVLQIGAGGLGCATAQYLVAAGLGELTLIDDDQVDVTNLHRQILHTRKDIGRAKVDSAKESLQLLNPDCQINTLRQRLNPAQMLERVTDCDLVLDCTDNLASRTLINRVCIAGKTPLVSAAAIRFEGQISTFSMQTDSPCYECLSHVFPEQELSCVEAGVMSPVVGIIGSMQAMEALKVICQFGESLAGRLLMLDAKSMRFNQFTLTKHPGCICHGTSIAP